MGVVRPAEAMPESGLLPQRRGRRAALRPRGAAACSTRYFGPIRYGPGDYLVLPIGTTWRLEPDAGSPQRMLYLECPSEIEPPKRYRNDYGQLLEHSPYSQRDIRAPGRGPAADRRRATSVIHVKMRDRLTAYHYRHHPFDVVGWDGYLWPFALQHRRLRADHRAGPPAAAGPPDVRRPGTSSSARSCRRKFDYHPLAIPAPYNHSNINSDEVIYYVAGNFMSRRGVGIASFTLHPAGIPHGPHPGTAEASIGKEATEELAVMVDTFHPLKITRQAATALEDDRYPYSWLPAEDASGEARELSGARTGGVPGSRTRLRKGSDSRAPRTRDPVTVAKRSNSPSLRLGRVLSIEQGKEIDALRRRRPSLIRGAARHQKPRSRPSWPSTVTDSGAASRHAPRIGRARGWTIQSSTTTPSGTPRQAAEKNSPRRGGEVVCAARDGPSPIAGVTVQPAGYRIE